MWIALDGDRIVAFRAFLRWLLRDEGDQAISAVRAVDTATDPDFQGRGLFTRLTLTALDDLEAAGVQLVFNTPNAKSLPGYRKMGWVELGRLPVTVRLTRLRSAFRLATARQPASRSSIETTVGEAACDVLADRTPVERLLASQPDAHGLGTSRTPADLAWRYGHPPLAYRAVLRRSSPEDGMVIFRLRRRGGAVEAAICEMLTPGGNAHDARAQVNEIARDAQADYLMRIGGPVLSRMGFVRVPGAGAILACRRLGVGPTPELSRWDLALGDVELL